MQNRQNHEKKNHHKNCGGRREITVIQRRVDVRFTLIIGTSSQPIENREKNVYDQVQQGVHPVEEADWNRAQKSVNHHENRVERMFCDVIGIDSVVFEENGPVSSGNP